MKIEELETELFKLRNENDRLREENARLRDIYEDLECIFDRYDPAPRISDRTLATPDIPGYQPDPWPECPWNPPVDQYPLLLETPLLDYALENGNGPFSETACIDSARAIWLT